MAAKLHFHPPVGLPPKYALQVFPLSAAQLQQRFDGLQAFLREVLAHLQRQHAAGLHHDARSSAGLDMQIFCDFVAHHRNRPPRPARGELPDWARPEAAASAWADADSVTDSEDGGLLESDGDVEHDEHVEPPPPPAAHADASARFRNELLQAEGALSALWHCVRAYKQATAAWWGAAAAVVDEYKRVADVPLFRLADAEEEEAGDGRTHAARLAKALEKLLEAVQPEFDKKCEDAVLAPLEQLSRDVLPEVKHTYWTRHSSVGGNVDAARELNARRLQQEREALHAKLRADVQSSMTALVALQNEMLAAMHDQLHGFERVQRMPRQRSQSQPVLNRRNSRRGCGSIKFSVARTMQASSSRGTDLREYDASTKNGSLGNEICEGPAITGANDVDEAMDADKSEQSEEGEDGNESDDEEGTAEDEADVENEDERAVDKTSDDQHVEEPSSHMYLCTTDSRSFKWHAAVNICFT
ncbi:Regulator of chromosome condensation (RCC1)-like protein [Phytophthora cinnamomi]|uniref:Regulator of chromosome condensation (RCC1)-like protein n=1 Tax=Phytophthora cinnamomi TaxID=4785 RepID=UPI00355A7742|nr:Regulator of chromosome condensation (RCC1)-like protein [Phytophthora cinnamomi]